MVSHCGKEYLARTEPANITSPGYPSNYPNNIDSCTTTIHANEGQQIVLAFEEFDIEYTPTCYWYYLEVTVTEWFIVRGKDVNQDIKAEPKARI